MPRLALPRGKKNKGTYGKKRNLFSYWQAILMSFYSVDLYVDVKHRWRGFGAIYLALVMALAALPWSIKVGVEKYNYYHQVLIPTLKKMPTLDIYKGELVFKKEQPYFLNNPVTHKPLVIIDTTGKIKDLPNKKYPSAALLFSKYAIVSQFGNMPPYVQKLDKDITAKISSKLIIPMFERLKNLFFTTFYPMVMMLWFGMAFGFLIVISFLLKMFSVAVLRYEITYRNALRLAAVSMTPMIFTFMIFAVLHLQGHGEGVLLFVIWFGYYIFAIRSNKFAAKHPLIIEES